MPEITETSVNNFIFDSAIENLYLGCPAPWDREILSSSPLPDDVAEPFLTQSVNIRDVMNITFFSLSGWISESQKTNYFSERFVSLSRLIHKGVLSMGRGLVTLYNHGEDLSCAPMQIGDLISAASYQFRKSYLGVLQSSAKFPEIGERLLINQLNWSDLLLRLFKTRDKLNAPNNRKAIEETEALPDNTAYKLTKAFDPDSAEALAPFSESELQQFSSCGGISPAAGFSAFKPAGAISPARALTSFDRTPKQRKHTASGKSAGKEMKTQLPASGQESQTPITAETKEQTVLTGPKNPIPVNDQNTLPEPENQTSGFPQTDQPEQEISEETVPVKHPLYHSGKKPKNSFNPPRPFRADFSFVDRSAPFFHDTG